MTRVITKLYNQERKEQYLSDFPKDTQKTYRRLFKISSPMEFLLEKDLSEFNQNELEDILYDLDPLTAPASHSNGRIITSYINWARDQDKSDKINPLKKVDGEWFNKFVDTSKKLYFTADEIETFENNCENAQDAVIVRLLFESINGKESIEIRMLHKDDVDKENNILTTRDEKHNELRKVKVSDRAIKLITDAYKETTYTKKNGQMEEHDNVRDFTDLIATDYIVRTSKIFTKKLNYGAVLPSVIYRRISAIGSYFDLPYFTTKNIFRSGVIYMGYQILVSKKEQGLEALFDKNDYLAIAARFNIKNHYTIKEYCNEEVIGNLYGMN